MYKEAIEEYFHNHKEEMLNDIMSVIKIKSDRGEPKEGMPFGDGPAKALKEVLSIADKMGFKTKNYDNYVGTVDFNNHEKQLDILAHLDVVPASNNWKVTKPFEPMIKDGKLYGRGSADDKGPAIVALHALKAIKELNIPLSKNARLILGTDEECGSEDIKYYYNTEKEAPMTFSPDADFPLINIEKGGLHSGFKAQFKNESKNMPKVISIKGGIKRNVVPDKATAIVEGISKDKILKCCDDIGKKTKVIFVVDEENNKYVITAKGSSAHGSTPEKGINAVTGLLELLVSMPFYEGDGFKKIKAIQKLYPHGDFYGEACGIAMGDELSGKLTMTLDVLEYSEGNITGIFDCRAPICATNENLRDVLKNKMKKNDIILDKDDIFEAHHVDENSEFIQTLLKCYEKYTGQKGKCLAIGGITYVHDLNNGVAFGCTMPGTDNNMHGDDEYAVVDELLVSAKIFTEAIIELCK